MDLKKLTDEFSVHEIEFRAGATNRDKMRALALPYLTSRAIMDRLDSVVGPANWRDEYQPGPGGGVLCGISIRCGEEWITKFDGADNTNIEAIKGGLSDAFKRAAVKWGIGRYLYSRPAMWVRAEVRGKTVVIDEQEARAHFFGQSAPAPQPAPPATNGNGRFRTIDDLLYTIGQDFGLSEEEAKDALKRCGYSAFKPSKSLEMYEAVERLVRTGEVIPF